MSYPNTTSMRADQLQRGDLMRWHHDTVQVRKVKPGKGTAKGSRLVYGTVLRTDEPTRVHYFDDETVTVTR